MRTSSGRAAGALLACLLLVLITTGCSRRQPPVARPAPPPPPPMAVEPAAPPTPPTPVPEPPPVPVEPVPDPTIESRSLDELNRDSPLRPAFFAYDSSDLTPEAQAALNANADLLKRFSTWAVTIEGHCDERGTPEYNLALGERRALAARDYLVALGITAGRLRTVSYGKEFPFDPGHSEAAWARNRRAHFVITAK